MVASPAAAMTEWWDGWLTRLRTWSG